ncbi:carbon-nitrogen hydrolase family protein [Oceanospirillum beijerinckii]|uniref:carbon-nitrogen hydrolase family protein n=1 Tax=Oceanospirillum beijerinckii TaxID=64976 RepID=UPI00040885BF|nr:carbon-nitrogen hydrolase family protein [Oceanospirillum beijerinckii]
MNTHSQSSSFQTNESQKNRSQKDKTSSQSQQVKVASAAYEVSFIESWQVYEDKIGRWVKEAVEKGAELLVFPEYFSMELASMFGEQVYSSLSEQLIAIQQILSDFKHLFSSLAQQHDLYIQSGTIPVLIEKGHDEGEGASPHKGKAKYVNRAYLFYPDGQVKWQDKLQMTRFENEQWFISAGEALKVFETRFGRLGINICYDSEFPMFARQQVEAGADLILVPSCTDTLAGYHRVQIGCRARALENQCFVIQSPLVGDALWSPAIDENRGAAGVFAPVDYGFPSDGIIEQLPLNQAGWCYAQLDLTELARVRQQGQVFNYRDWPGQMRIDHCEVE